LALESVYLNDIKHAKNTLIIHANCPNFPDAMWFDVLLNKYINLDRIFSGNYALELDSSQLQSIGDIDISINNASGLSKNSKMIHSHREWTIAYTSTKGAILFAYPHRAQELFEYKKYIIGLFAAAAAAVPAKNLLVIQLNWAICLHIACSNNISFILYHRYNDLITHHLIMGTQNGLSNQPSSSSKQTQMNPHGADVEICK